MTVCWWRLGCVAERCSDSPFLSPSDQWREASLTDTRRRWLWAERQLALSSYSHSAFSHRLAVPFFVVFTALLGGVARWGDARKCVCVCAAQRSA